MEVVDTSMAYKRTRDPDNPSKGFLPLGTIQVKKLQTFTANTEKVYAHPASNVKVVPLIGEHISCFKVTSPFANAGHTTKKTWYYTVPVNFHGNVNANPLPNAAIEEKKKTSGADFSNYVASGAPQSSVPLPYKPGGNFVESSKIRSLQIFEGDTLVEGRHGHGLRFSSGISGNKSKYGKNPSWDGKQGSPITMLSNGQKNAPFENQYRIESPDDTESMIILSSDQKIQKFTPSQAKIGPAVDAKSYSKSQIILSADRLHFDSKLDEIILTTKSDVIISTPNWQMQLDVLYTEIEKLVDAITKMTHPTGVGPSGVPVNLADFEKILNTLKEMKSGG
jgi:hypothetical protein